MRFVVVEEPAWELFDRIAADYDQIVPFFAEYGAAIVDVLDPPAGCRLLDLGAGRGALTGPALARGCVMTAVDAAPAMIERLAAAHPAAATHVMKAEALRLPSDHFDLVVTAFVIHVHRAGVAIAFPDNATLWRWALSHGYRAFIEDLPDERRREFHDRILALPADERVLRRTTGVWSGRKPG